MDTLLAKPMICREFHLNSYNLAEGRYGQGGIFTAPGNKNSAAADVFGVHGGSHPKRRRRNMTPELDINSRALSPVNISHCRVPTFARVAPQVLMDQYRQWAIALCFPRLSRRYRRSDCGIRRALRPRGSPGILRDFIENYRSQRGLTGYADRVNIRQLPNIFSTNITGVLSEAHCDQAIHTIVFVTLKTRTKPSAFPENSG